MAQEIHPTVNCSLDYLPMHIISANLPIKFDGIHPTQTKMWWQCRHVLLQWEHGMSGSRYITNHLSGPLIDSCINHINSLFPGISGCDFENAIFNLVLLTGILRSTYDNTFRWLPQDFSDDKLTLVQVMAWCHQAPSHYLSQCWPRFMSP